MKKLIYILITFSAFTFGVVVYYLRPIVEPVSLCEISQHSELYNFNEIYIEAYLDYVYEDESHSYFVDDFGLVTDFGNGCITGARLDISEKLKDQLKNEVNLNLFFKELRQKNNELMENRAEGHFIGQVEIIGNIEKQQEDGTIGLGARPPFIIKANEIRQIAPIRILSHEEILEIQKFNNQE